MEYIDLRLDQNKRRPDYDLLASLVQDADLSDASRQTIVKRATGYVQAVRCGAKPGLMEA